MRPVSGTTSACNMSGQKASYLLPCMLRRQRAERTQRSEQQRRDGGCTSQRPCLALSYEYKQGVYVRALLVLVRALHVPVRANLRE